MVKRNVSKHYNSYEEVLEYLHNEKRVVNLLLGNGFSMAYNPAIFSYNALAGKISSDEDSTLKTLFDTIKTSNFEDVMQSLDILLKLANAFGADGKFIQSIKDAYSKLQVRLINTIEKIHPEHVFKLTSNEIELCGNFLVPFLSKGGEDIFLDSLRRRECIHTKRGRKPLNFT